MPQLIALRRPGLAKGWRNIRRPPGPAVINWDSPQAEGLTYWAAFDQPEGPTLVDRANGNNGAFAGAGMTVDRWNSPPDYGGFALTFGPGSASKYVTVPTDPALILTQGTFSVWMKPNSLPGANYYSLVEKGTTTAEFQLYLTSTNGYLAFFATAGSLTSTTAPAVGVYSHFVATVNPNIAILYLNGVQVTSAVGFALTGIADPLEIGTYSPVGVNEFDGDIMDARINNVALSASVVAQMADPATMWDLYASGQKVKYFFIPTSAAAVTTYNAPFFGQVW